MSRRCGTRSGRLGGLLRLDRVHHGQILACEAVIIFARFVEEHAVAVVALLAAEICGAVFGRAILSAAKNNGVSFRSRGGAALGRIP